MAEQRYAHKLGRNQVINLYGIADSNLKYLERTFNVEISGKNDHIDVKGKKRDVTAALFAFKKLSSYALSGRQISLPLLEETVLNTLEPVDNKKETTTRQLVVSSRRDSINAKTPNQQRYIDTIFQNQVVFGIGPAGTGKTYLATAAALYYLREKLVERIILVRPVVEAGETLGFLPGDLKEKIDPYLRPLFDAIYDMIEPRIFHELVENEVIEVAPLAYMRGRTLNKAFVILDEAQNTTIDQMKMFLTRTGNNSKLVITGDITQIDLPVGKKSGLIHAMEVFEGMEEMKFCMFDASDVSRAEVVKKVLEAYERYEKKQK